MFQVDGRCSLNLFTHLVIHQFGKFGWEFWKGGRLIGLIIPDIFLKYEIIIINIFTHVMPYILLLLKLYTVYRVYPCMAGFLK